MKLKNGKKELFDLWLELNRCIKYCAGAKKDELSIEKLKKVIAEYYWTEDFKFVD